MNTESAVERRLPLEIHAATRSCHTVLNRLITSHLPLCLPPHANNPALYAKGIAAFGQIYLTFEEVWDEILGEEPDDPRIHEALKQLRILSLARSARLRADFSLLDRTLNGRGSLQAGNPSELAPLTGRIRQAILDKPHLILSYAWVMYMALFNGGRWMRGQLHQSGPEFWGAQQHDPPPKIDCLSFWEFEGELDGEDIKDDFKARFNTAAAVLDDTECRDVVEESAKIFETCSQMVAWLDTHTLSGSSKPNAIPESQSWLVEGYAAASSMVCGIWSGLSRATPSIHLQRSEQHFTASRNTS